MPDLGRFSRELRARFWKPPVADEVRDELAYHLEMLEQDLMARGCSPEQARQAALRRFGDVERIGAECRELGEKRDVSVRRSRWFAEFAQDVGHSLRQLRSNRRFALVAILTLGIGLGAATTIFGIANAVLLRPLPFHEPSRLVLVDEVNSTGDAWAMSEPNFLDLRARLLTVPELAAMAPRRLTILGGGAPERLAGVAASASLFTVLGVEPALGRTFTASEDSPGGDLHVAVLADGLWRRRFGADPGILDRSIDLDGVSYQVIGVMPAGYDFPGRTDIWIPLAASATAERGDRRLQGVGRLAEGASVATAAQEIARAGAELARRFPQANGAWKARVRPFEALYVSPALEARVLVLMAAVGLLILMACINITCLLLARAGARQHEMAIRAALGAGHGRIVRQLLTESIVLAALGTALGVALAAVAVPLIRSTGSAAVPMLSTMRLDWRVMAFALAACATTSAGFGLAPALSLTRSTATRGGGVTRELLRTGSRVVGGNGLRGALVLASVALATVMVVSAGLVGGSFVRLMRTDLGFSPDRVLTASVVLPGDRYDYDQSAAFFQQLMPALAEIPGVRAAGAVNLAPFSGGNTAMDFVPGASAPADPRDFRNAAWRAVTPGYFEALGVRLERGRLFDDGDVFEAPFAVVINQAMARRDWPGEDPIGRQVTLGNTRTLTVVGIVADSRLLAVESAPTPTMYFAHAQFPWQEMWLTVSTTGDPMSVLPAVRREIAAIDPRLALARVQPVERLVHDDAAEPRLTMLVLGIFAVAALTLVAVGLYGLVSYSVVRRTREIGVRLALGAPGRRVAGMVVSEGVRLALMGIALGAVLSLVAARSLRAVLYETRPDDGVIYLLAGALTLAVVLVASAVPAIRASRLDPVEALRRD